MTGPDAEHDPAWREDVESGRVCRHVHGLANASLRHVGTELQRLGYCCGAAERHPRRCAGPWMIPHQQPVKAGPFQPLG